MLMQSREGSGAIHTLNVHPARPFLVATGTEDGSVYIWESRNYKQPLCRYKQHSGSGKRILVN
jgi:hypothetical protein